jgi:acyl-[acyl-carrier-protein] desaturase
VLRHWNVFERTGFGPEGEAAREELVGVLAALDSAATRFEDSRDRALARAAARG